VGRRPKGQTLNKGSRLGRLRLVAQGAKHLRSTTEGRGEISPQRLFRENYSFNENEGKIWGDHKAQTVCRRGRARQSARGERSQPFRKLKITPTKGVGNMKAFQTEGDHTLCRRLHRSREALPEKKKDDERGLSPRVFL